MSSMAANRFKQVQISDVLDIQGFFSLRMLGQGIRTGHGPLAFGWKFDFLPIWGIIPLFLIIKFQ
jgi:hypothetical protein